MHQHTDMRFHIVVFNHNHIELFLDNFNKIENFNKLKDQIVIVDCSSKFQEEKNKVLNFCRQHDLVFNKHIFFLRRKNWGIDQGGRIDYFSFLNKLEDRPLYIWQMQEHYLDTTSARSKWGRDIKNIDGSDLFGQMKLDIIPDNFSWDLDQCESVYESNPHIGVLYANRNGIGVFKLGNEAWFYADGANFSARSKVIVDAFDEVKLNLYRLLYDSTYNFALFCEFTICLYLNMEKSLWYDLASNKSHHISNAVERNDQDGTQLFYHVAEKEYIPLYRLYLDKWKNLEGKQRIYKIFLTLKFHMRVFLRDM